MQKFERSLCNNLPTCKVQYVGQTKRTFLEHFQGHYGKINKALRNPDQVPGTRANAHTNQLQEDTIGLHFAQTNHKGARDLKISVLEFISLPINSERALQLCILKEIFWTHRLRCSAPQRLNIMEWKMGKETHPSVQDITLLYNHLTYMSWLFLKYNRVLSSLTHIHKHGFLKQTIPHWEQLHQKSY